MIHPFFVENNDSEVFNVTCQRHEGLCWRLLISGPAGEEAGDLLFEPQDAVSVRLRDFHIHPEFARKGIGTQVMAHLRIVFREHGFQKAVGICKSYEYLIAEKEKLAQWYLKLGFSLIRENKAGIPGYIGKLEMNL